MTEKVVTKVTNEELERVRKLRIEFQEIMLKIGQAELQIYDLKNSIANISEHRNSLLTRYEGLKKEELDEMKKISDKYGIGSLNIEDGSYTPQE